MTRADNNLTLEDVKLIIKDKFGYKKVGFHFIVLQNGVVKNGLPLYKPGLFCKGHNKHSIGIIYVGGVNQDGLITDTRNDIQKFSLERLISNLCILYPCKVVGIDTYRKNLKIGFDCNQEYRSFNITP